MTMLSETKPVVLNVETTGLSPAMALCAAGFAGIEKERVMGGVSLWKVFIGFGAIILVFALFGFLMWQARRTHTRKVGGRTYWDIIYGRFPRMRRRRKK